MRFHRAALTLLAGAIPALTFASDGKSTFHHDAERVLQARCQGCHRPGEVAPMSLLTYGDARPWAKAIKVAVATKKMPPWFAEPGYRQIANERKLTAREIETLVAWVDNGAVEGDPKDAPAPLSFIDGWNITPDIVVEMPKPFELPATGTI